MTAKTKRPLKKYNGRGQGYKYSDYTVCVAATSDAMAARLVSIACFGKKYDNLVSTHEIKTYFSKGRWGVRMDGIEPTEPCAYVYQTNNLSAKPIRKI